MKSEESDDGVTDYLRSACLHCEGIIEFPNHGRGQEILCPHCGALICLQEGCSPVLPMGYPRKQREKSATPDSNSPPATARLKSLTALLVGSVVALAILFWIMPSAKELSDNRAQLKSAEKIYNDYHSMPGAAQEYTDYLVKDRSGSTPWFDRQYSEACSKPQSRFTGGVMFWGLVSLGQLFWGTYLAFVHFGFLTEQRRHL